ncbi:ubiquitin [Caldibacillus lycopersici]|uniref:Ubiquitin n=1 Tax=Perspicuibacillus lycopersici TaxID=1325689 RepID=A0AAE3IST0_9BACI|nr:EsaB/YukD family protein [Perspicuibacillus lycopersici]MCU9612786.1 ubiquitin [Perspicuibacillus lycopersici]
MYIQITVDLKNYTNEVFDLRLSNYHSIKKFIHIIWQAKYIPTPPTEGYWIRVQNKELVLNGDKTLISAGITNGDRIEIL